MNEQDMDIILVNLFERGIACLERIARALETRSENRHESPNPFSDSESEIDNIPIERSEWTQLIPNPVGRLFVLCYLLATRSNMPDANVIGPLRENVSEILENNDLTDADVVAYCTEVRERWQLYQNAGHYTYLELIAINSCQFNTIDELIAKIRELL